MVAEPTAPDGRRGHRKAIAGARLCESQELNTGIATYIWVLTNRKRRIGAARCSCGLKLNAPLKPSGITWIGRIAEHWQASALRRHWEVLDCKHVTVPFFDEGIPLVSVVEFQNF